MSVAQLSLQHVIHLSHALLVVCGPHNVEHVTVAGVTTLPMIDQQLLHCKALLIL